MEGLRAHSGIGLGGSEALDEGSLFMILPKSHLWQMH